MLNKFTGEMKMFNFLKSKNKLEKEKAQLENFDDEIWVIQDVVITVEAEGDKPEQKYEGKMIISRFPTDKD